MTAGITNPNNDLTNANEGFEPRNDIQIAYGNRRLECGEEASCDVHGYDMYQWTRGPLM